MVTPKVLIPETLSCCSVKSVAVVIPKVLIPETLSCCSVKSVAVVIPKVLIPLIDNDAPTILVESIVPTKDPSNDVAVIDPLTLTSPRTSREVEGSKIVVPIPARPTTSNTFLLSVSPVTPIFCCCCLPLVKRIGAVISYIRD